MKQLIALSILILNLTFLTSAQNEEKISIGEKVTLFSKILNENRKLWIYTPDQTSIAQASDKRYPVLYLLDGEVQFYSTVGLIQQLSQANLNSMLPEMIVVGIENTNRYRDLIPKANTASPFVSFIEKELFEYVDANYKTAPYRVLTAHSLGGLLAIDILTKQPEMFNAYVAIDPSMWYAGEQFLNNAITQLPNQKLNNRKLFVGVANSLPENVSMKNIGKNKSPETQHLRSILKMGDFFNKQPINGIQYKQKFYEMETHNSVPLITQYDGLRFIFDYYNSKLGEKDFQDSTSLIATKLKNHYQKVSKELGYTVAPPEQFINFIAYDALSKKQFSKARSLYLLNIENYPSSNTALAAYADFLAVMKETANATKFYQQSLLLKEDKSIRQRMFSLSNQGIALTENELKYYVGQYVLENYNISITLELRDGKLMSKVPGQADSEFVPLSKDVFTVKDKQGYNITFSRENGLITGFTSVQPNGTFRAKKI
jgi:predicted alpha/beta superfamily hydrolase